MDTDLNKVRDDNVQQSLDAKKNTSKKSLFVISVMLLFNLALAGSLFYLYTVVKAVENDLVKAETSFKDLSDRLSKTQEVVNYNNSRVENLTLAQNSAVQNNYSYQMPTYANITIEGVTEDINSSLEEGFRFVILDVKLENNTQNELYFSTSELKLKDTDNYEYPFYGQGVFTNDFIKKDSKVILPGNRIPISYASLRPGEVVKGSAVFIVNKSGKQYSLLRNGELLKSINL